MTFLTTCVWAAKQAAPVSSNMFSTVTGNNVVSAERERKAGVNQNTKK